MKAALLASLLLAGCASLPDGVTMTDADRVTCKKSQDCTVWSVDELHKLIQAAVHEGIKAGRQAAKGDI